MAIRVFVQASALAPLVLRLVGEAAARRDEAERHFREMVVTARAAGIPLNGIAEVVDSRPHVSTPSLERSRS
jgi:hypothetical protein